MGLIEAQMRGEGLRRGIAHVEDIGNKLLEKCGSVAFLVNCGCGFAGADDFVDLKPFGDELFAGVRDHSAHETWFGADEEGCAFRSERVAALRVLIEELESNESVHDGGEAPGGGSSSGVDFVDCFGAGVECVKDLVAEGGLEDQRGGIGPGKLHDPLRGDWGGGGGGLHCCCAHGFSFR